MLAIILIALTSVLWLIPIRIGLSFRQDALQAELKVAFTFWPIHLERAFDLTEQAKSVLGRLWLLWRETGRVPPIEVPEAARTVDWDAVVKAVVKPIGYLVRHTVCRNLRVSAELGGFDAMQSAMLAAAAWAAVGMVLGLLQSAAGVAVPHPRVIVRPRWDAPVWRVRSACILQIRCGYAIVAGVWLLWRAVRSKELRAWLRNRRRKGVKGSGRASDSRPDEDGHGEP